MIFFQKLTYKLKEIICWFAYWVVQNQNSIPREINFLLQNSTKLLWWVGPNILFFVHYKNFFLELGQYFEHFKENIYELTIELTFLLQFFIIFFLHLWGLFGGQMLIARYGLRSGGSITSLVQVNAEGWRWTMAFAMSYVLSSVFQQIAC